MLSPRSSEVDISTVSVVPRRVPGPLLAALLLILAWVLAGVVLLGLPRVDAPRRVDALLVLGPADGRLAQADRLMRDGAAGTLAVSMPAPVIDVPGTSGFCAAEHPYPVVCFAPDPISTQGEAQAFAGLAEQQGWSSAAVLTHRSHLTRAGILLRRCFEGRVDQLASEERYVPVYWAVRLVYETGAWTKMALTPGCEDELPFRWRTA